MSSVDSASEASASDHHDPAEVIIAAEPIVAAADVDADADSIDLGESSDDVQMHACVTRALQDPSLLQWGRRGCPRAGRPSSSGVIVAAGSRPPKGYIATVAAEVIFAAPAPTKKELKQRTENEEVIDLWL